MKDDDKDRIRKFWNSDPCGEAYAQGESRVGQLAEQARQRYVLEPYLAEFARFEDGEGKDVLEVGVGMGADHLEWARHKPRTLKGIDITSRAVDITRERFLLEGLTPDVVVADAERLPFEDESFDLVYSWGVIHHSPDTRSAIEEVRRVLRPGGRARIMIYHKWSIVGLVLWTRYGLLRGRPMTSLEDIYANYLESPGTKAYTAEQADDMFGRFSRRQIRSQLTFGDLLQGAVGQRHRGPLLTIARELWPRRALRRFAPRWGLALLIEATR